MSSVMSVVSCFSGQVINRLDDGHSKPQSFSVFAPRPLGPRAADAGAAAASEPGGARCQHSHAHTHSLFPISFSRPIQSILAQMYSRPCIIRSHSPGFGFDSGHSTRAVTRIRRQSTSSRGPHLRRAISTTGSVTQ